MESKIQNRLDELGHFKYSIERVKEDIAKIDKEIENLIAKKELMEQELKELKYKKRMFVNFPHDYQRNYTNIFR